VDSPIRDQDLQSARLGEVRQSLDRLHAGNRQGFLAERCQTVAENELQIAEALPLQDLEEQLGRRDVRDGTEFGEAIEQRIEVAPPSDDSRLKCLEGLKQRSLHRFCQDLTTCQRHDLMRAEPPIRATAQVRGNAMSGVRSLSGGG
jgi:hypothetical protein